MHSEIANFIPKFLMLFLISILFSACSEINSGWEVDGGGFIKYNINNQATRTIELDDDDATLPAYGRHYFSLETREHASDVGDRLAFLVADPKLGKNAIVQDYTWFIYEFAPKANVIPDSSYVTFDQKDDSTWTGDFKLHFPNCKTGTCNENKILTVSGRFRFWPDPDD